MPVQKPPLVACVHQEAGAIVDLGSLGEMLADDQLLRFVHHLPLHQLSEGRAGESVVNDIGVPGDDNGQRHEHGAEENGAEEAAK